MGVDFAGLRLTFRLFAQSPPFAQLATVCRNFDWDGPRSFVKNGAGLSDRVISGITCRDGDGAVSQYYNDPLRKAAE